MSTANMVKIDLPYIVEDIDRHGNVRVYFRRNGRKIRIREPVGSDAFHSRYGDLRAGTVDLPVSDGTVKPNTFRWLCVQFFGSSHFKRLDHRTQYVRRRNLEAMLCEPISPSAKQTFADFPLDRLRAKELRVLRDRKADLPGAADNRVRVLRGLFKWAVKNDHAPTNPARDVEYVGRDSDGWHSWTVDELDKYEKRHPIGTKARLALALLMYTGVRRSDVVRLGRDYVHDGWLKFKTKKTGVEVEIPIVPALQEVIDATPVVGAKTFLVTQYGKPITVAGFGNWFKDRCREASLPEHCSAHGVRKASAARAAENGATTHHLMALFGWLSIQEAEHYTRGARRKVLAKDAATLLRR